MAAQTPTKETWELWAVVLGVLAAAYAIIRWPLWWSFQRLVCMALEKELGKIEANAAAVSAHADSIKAILAIQEAQGVALREVPRMSGLMAEMTRTLEGLNQTVGTLNQNMMDHGQELGRVTGFIESGAWKGEERRRKGRRQEDPPLEGP